MDKSEFISMMIDAKTDPIPMRSIYESWSVLDDRSSVFDLLIIDEQIPGYVFSFSKNAHITSSHDSYQETVIKRELGLDIIDDIDRQIVFKIHSRINSAIGYSEFMHSTDKMVMATDVEIHSNFIVIHIKEV